MTDKAGDKYVPIEHTPAAGTAYIHVEIHPDDLPVFEATVGRIIDQRLAALGGHLLSDYGNDAPKPSSDVIAIPLSSLGGYLLEHYGTDDVPDAQTSNTPDR